MSPFKKVVLAGSPRWDAARPGASIARTAEGFIRLFALPERVRAARRKEGRA